jgi:hypothetical protein
LAKALWFAVKLLVIPVVCIAALIAGLAVGYTVLGKGQLADVFDWGTWKHMYDLVFAD